MTKNELRKAMRALNRSVDARQRAAVSLRIVARVEELPDFARARTVGLYCALPDEPDLSDALVRWSGEKRLVVPRVEGETMRLFDYDPQTLVTGAFGILEPGPAARLCAPGEIDLLLVPGVALPAKGRVAAGARGTTTAIWHNPNSGVRSSASATPTN